MNKFLANIIYYGFWGFLLVVVLLSIGTSAFTAFNFMITKWNDPRIVILDYPIQDIVLIVYGTICIVGVTSLIIYLLYNWARKTLGETI